MVVSFPAKNAFAILTGLALALAVWVALPSMVVANDDDFWYLRSTIESIQKGRPWTDAWLTPWGASTTGIAALVFRATGSFTLAIHLPLALYAGLTAVAMARVLRSAGINPLLSSGTTVMLLLCPTVFFMFINFTGVALYMACLWWCLDFARHGRWGWFLVPWVLALASRQSAIVWLALPGWALLREIWRERTSVFQSRRVWALAGVFAAAGISFLALKSFMNPTAGQKYIMESIKGPVNFDRMSGPLMLGVLMILAGRSIASTACLLGRAGGEGRGPLLLRAILAPFLALAGMVGAVFFLHGTIQTHDCFGDDFSGRAFPVLGGILGLGLAFGVTNSRPDCLLGALGSIALLCLYGGKNDYYFVDALFLGIASALPIGNSDGAESARSRFFKWPRWVVSCLLLLGVGYWVGRGYVRQMADQDRAAAIITLYEKAMDEGKILPSEVGIAPFGYHGWLFQDYYARNIPQPTIGGFISLVDGWDGISGSGVLTTYPKQLRSFRDIIPSRNNGSLRESEEASVLMEIKHPFLIWHEATYTLKGIATSIRSGSPAVIDPAKFQRIPFPTTDAGWRKLILESPKME